MFTLVENGRVYDPEPRGVQSVLIASGRIAAIGDVDVRALDRLGVEVERVDAEECSVVPGLVDPHGHLLGGSGEGSLALQTPMMFVHEIARAGVTTVVGTLGVDTTMKTIAGLLARVKALSELGLTARMWTGGYNVPPTTVLGSVREDMLFIDEVVGAGEIAISDERGLHPSPQALATLVRDTRVGGTLTGKAGLTHFHVGEERERLKPLREIIDDFAIQHAWLYPTHVHRSAALMREAITLARHGSYVDMDVVDQNIARWLSFYLEHDGPADKLTVSSDMDSSTPAIFFDQLCGLVVRHRRPLERVLPFFSTNAADALCLKNKGRLRVGMDGDLAILADGTLEVRHVVAGGRVLVRDGEAIVRERWLEKSKRDVHFTGDEHPSRQ